MRNVCVAVVLAIAALLAGCSDVIDTDARRLCRSVLPALYDDGSRFTDISTDEFASSTASSPVVILRYRHSPPAATSPSPSTRPSTASLPLRTLTCSFEATSEGRAPKLVAVATDRTALGPLRLHILQKFWIDSGLASGSDPAPIAVARFAPTLPMPIATILQQSLAALPAIAFYSLLATAYSLIYGLIGRINLAFGDLASLAGYGAFLGFCMLGSERPILAVTLALVVGLATAIMHGGVLGHAVLKRMTTTPGQHVLIATIGMSIVWQEAMRLTQGTGSRWISPLANRPIGVAQSDQFIVTVTPMALIVSSIALLAAWGLVRSMRRSRFGLSWRAMADDPIAAALLGVNPGRVLVRTMILAGALSGLCGVLTTLYYGGVGYAGGLIIGLKALIAAIIGGIGSIPGALIGGLLLGVAETVWASTFQIEYRDPAIFIALAILLWLRPGGLFGDATHHYKER
jgi:branched-chain amino acid transport system permease protein